MRTLLLLALTALPSAALACSGTASAHSPAVADNDKKDAPASDPAPATDAAAPKTDAAAPKADPAAPADAPPAVDAATTVGEAATGETAATDTKKKKKLKESNNNRMEAEETRE